MIRVLHYGLGPNPGGIETYLTDLAATIDRDRFTFDFLHSDVGRPPVGAELLRAGGSRFYPMTPRRTNPARNRRDVERILATAPVDLLHFHVNTASYFTPVRVALRIGLPVIVHSHSAGVAGSARTQALHRVGRASVRWDRVTKAAVSPEAGRWLFGNAPDITPLRPGLDLDRFAYDAGRRAKVRATLELGERFVVGVVGAFLPAKNVPFAIEVFAEVRRARPDAVLLLVGDGPLIGEIRTVVAEQGLDESVHFLGARSDVPDLLCAMDTLLFPSLFEGLGLVPLEAQAAGLPCVVSDVVPVAATPTRAVHRLSLSEPPAAWAAAVIAAGNRPDRHDGVGELSAAGYSLTAAASAVEAVYDEVLAGPRSHLRFQRRRLLGKASRPPAPFFGTTSETEAQPLLWGAVVTYRRPDELARMLSKVATQTRPVDRLVVVDNGSDEAVHRAAEAAGATYLDAGGNLGPAGGVALAMKHVLAQAGPDDWLLLLDDDDPPADDDALARLWEFGQERLAADPHTGGVGELGGFYNRRLGIFRRPEDAELVGPVSIDVIGGGHLPMYRCAAIREVGPMDADLFFGFEEGEYGLRLRTAGYRLYADAEPWLAYRDRHGERDLRSGQMRTAENKAAWRRYYGVRNATLLADRYAAPWAPIVVAAGGAWRGARALRRTGAPLADVLLPIRGAVDGLRRRDGRTINPDQATK